MSDLCNSVTAFGALFIMLAFVVAAIEAVIAIIVKWQARKTQPSPGALPTLAGVNLGPILEALARVLAALKDLPPWIGFFLAGLALVWTASTAPQLCT